MKKDSSNKLMTTYFTREHSLFYCYAWSENDMRCVDWGDTDSISLFIGEGKTHKISVWYNQEELDIFFEKLTRKINNNPEYFKRLKKEFYKYWDDMLPFLQKKKELKTIEELEHFYYLFMNWWTTLSDVFYIPEADNVAAEIKAEALQIREATQEYANEHDNVFVTFFEKHFPEYRDLAYVIAPEEIFLLKQRKLTAEEITKIRSRLNGYIVLNSKLYSHDDLEKVLKQYNLKLDIPQVKNVHSIKGITASKGRVKGKVRIILFKKDINKLKKGEILVTEMTAPDFVPAIEKSAAIVTDEGGVTCHAAIVSREFKKPCIIGTKIATKVLKDGDMVEVDANKGIVTILNSNK